MTVQTWIANEIEFTSSKIYANPFEDVDILVTFSCAEQSLEIPAFWDGKNTWKVRFALPKEGVWEYSATCTDAQNTGLCGKGKITCVKYDGDLDIYKRGFIKTERGARYFMYNDGTPFFYLGDTHWNFAAEEFDEAGEHAGNTVCSSHFKYIVDKRAQQGFTVYQSEPIGAKYNIGDGIDEDDIEGFKDLDRRFKYIADKGFVHANAQIAFPQELIRFARYDDKQYLRRLGKYWAARYSAFPCLWTLGQEVDNDFYYVHGHQKQFTKETNPYKIIAEGLHENDAYKHPMTGHMEYFNVSARAGEDGTCPASSAFRETKGHTWYGYQWNRDLAKPVDYSFGLDGLISGQGKVCILYESKYDHLWTKHFGARSQGWLAFLNGLYGYGYGAIDIWLYKSTYDIDTESNDGIDTITPEDKNKYWSESIEFESAYQMQYMRRFFEKLQWWKLLPRFDSPAYFTADKEKYYSIASDERKTIVLYFCNHQAYDTGCLHGLDNCEYTYQWFNPRSGEYSEKHSFFPDAHRMYHVEQKPDPYDWVLLVQKA